MRNQMWKTLSLINLYAIKQKNFFIIFILIGFLLILFDGLDLFNYYQVE